MTIYGYPSPVVRGISPTAVPLNVPTTLTVAGSGFTNVSAITINGKAQPTGFTSSTSLTAEVPASLLTTPGVFSVVVTTPSPGGGTSAPQYLTAYVLIVNNSMVYNPVNGLFYLSIPSSAGVPYGNTVVSIDPLTGVLGVPIPVGAEPDQLAITADGRYLWVALDGSSSVRNVDVQTGVAGPPFTTVPESFGFAAAVLAAVPARSIQPNKELQAYARKKNALSRDIKLRRMESRDHQRASTLKIHAEADKRKRFLRRSSSLWLPSRPVQTANTLRPFYRESCRGSFSSGCSTM